MLNEEHDLWGIGGGDRRSCCVYSDIHSCYVRTLISVAMQE